ncbi:hypothetical protein GCM10010300_33850 [Streptomyces olivaceoviridis]|nr:hypothetical protein GCM10010300_33850 [Streptomyces olivaceoviridis]
MARATAPAAVEPTAAHAVPAEAVQDAATGRAAAPADGVRDGADSVPGHRRLVAEER